jgi:hypothetical protein
MPFAIAFTAFMLPSSTAVMATTNRSSIGDTEGLVITAAVHLGVKNSFLTRDQIAIFIVMAASFGSARTTHWYFGSTLVRVN